MNALYLTNNLTTFVIVGGLVHFYDKGMYRKGTVIRAEQKTEEAFKSNHPEQHVLGSFQHFKMFDSEVKEHTIGINSTWSDERKQKLKLIMMKINISKPIVLS